MYVKEFKYPGFKLIAFKNADINIFEFSKPPDIKPEPLHGRNNQIINPGDKVVAIKCNKTSAGFGSLYLKQDHLTYLGRYKTPEREFILFEFKKPGVYYGYKFIEMDDMFDPGILFFLNYAGAGRMIEIDEIILFKDKNQNQG